MPAGTGGVAVVVVEGNKEPSPPPPLFLSFEEGESPLEVRHRVSAALSSIAASFLPPLEEDESGRGIGRERETGPETETIAVAVVSHGGAISSAAAQLFPGVPVPSRSANGSVSEIVVARKRERKKRKKEKEETEKGDNSSSEEEKEEKEREPPLLLPPLPPSFEDFEWRLLRWGDASHMPQARLSGGGAGAG